MSGPLSALNPPAERVADWQDRPVSEPSAFGMHFMACCWRAQRRRKEAKKKTWTLWRHEGAAVATWLVGSTPQTAPLPAAQSYSLVEGRDMPDRTHGESTFVAKFRAETFDDACKMRDEFLLSTRLVGPAIAGVAVTYRYEEPALRR